MRRAFWPSTAALVAVIGVLPACSAVGVRVLGSSREAALTAPNLDSLVLQAAASPPPAPSPPAEADVAIEPAPPKFTGPARLRPPPSALAEPSRGTQPGTWAVVIGINDYPGTAHDLRSAVPDAEEVNRALDVMGVPADHRLSITDGQASARVIASAVDWLVARAGPDAVAVFFFAGHVRKQGPATEAMVGADGNVVTDAQLARRLAPLRARRLWVAMAACYGGGFTEVLRDGVVLTGASGADDRAYENASFNRSYMVEYMVRQAMVEGRASESVEAAYAYARESLARDFPQRVLVQIDRSPGALNLRPPGFVATPPASVPPVPTSGKGGTPPGSSTTTTTTTQPSPTSTTTTTKPDRRCNLGLSAGNCVR